jgi:5-methylcytosine-specific restriction endonuclease McrA
MEITRRKRCQYCQKEFIGSYSNWRRQKYCSKECRYLDVHMRRSREYQCPVCGCLFRSPKSIIRVFCSNMCRLKNQSNPITHFNCEECGKECCYSDYNFQRSVRFCSRRCYRKYWSRASRGEASHFWKGGKIKENTLLRSRSKTKRWRNLVFSRDGYTCQICGLKSGNGKTVWIEAHHIKSWAKYPQLRWDVDNGITLCRECHKKTDNYGGKK